jgi:iron complex outermembrane receptor protein
MTRSRRRKIAREKTGLGSKSHTRALLRRAPFASAMLAALPSAWAQTDDGALEEVVVSAQKREENLQKVPLSITALGTAKLDQLQVVEFTDFAKFLPSVAFQSLGPGVTSVYMRGVASGENSNHSGPLPSVGMYLDEQPITTITGALDVHIYDVARVEALAGPQGTLYGASSQAGTIRIITNKPDPSEFKGSYDLSVQTVSSGDPGYLGEGFVNIPLSERAAIRLVGWVRHDGGYIDNVAGTRTYPSLGVPISNADIAEENYNDVDTYGARAALRIDLNDSWTITPTIMGQDQEWNGYFGFDPQVGDLKVTHFKPEFTKDKWGQAALTVEGRLSNLDLVYAGAFLKRDVDSSADYTDYTYFYDVNYGYGAMSDDNGNPIDPSQYFEGKDRFSKNSHELRLSTDPGKRLRAVVGLFTQTQKHKIHQRYKIDNMESAIEVTGWEDTLWLTQQTREDRDDAIFGEVTFDLTPKLSATAGLRYFEADNTLVGFFGYGLGWSSSGSGEAQCDPDPANWVPYKGAPCTNLDKGIKEDGTTPRFNLTYNIDESRLVYATYSEGFRPGGINRRGTLPPFNADFLKNYELGWKTSWANNRLRFNGAIFQLDWEDIQFSYLGQSGLTEIKNANDARVKGFEADVSWAVTGALNVTGGFSYIDAELTENYCGSVDPVTGAPETNCAAPLAPAGTRLPVSSKVKSNLTARYTFPLQGFDAHLQTALVYQGNAYSDLTPADRAIIGRQDAYTIANFSGGLQWGNSSVELFVHNAFDERANDFRTTQCAVYGFDGNPACGLQPYSLIARPRTIGVRFGQRF